MTTSQGSPDRPPQDSLRGLSFSLLGPLEVSQQTYRELLAQAEEDGDLRWDTEQASQTSTQRVGVMLALIGASREYQFA